MNSYFLSLWNASLTKHVYVDHTWPRCGNGRAWSTALLWAMRGISMGHGLPYDIDWKKTFRGWLINLPVHHSYDQSRIFKCLHSDFNYYLRKFWEIIGVCSFFFLKGGGAYKYIDLLTSKLGCRYNTSLVYYILKLLYKLECFLGISTSEKNSALSWNIEWNTQSESPYLCASI